MQKHCHQTISEGLGYPMLRYLTLVQTFNENLMNYWAYVGIIFKDFVDPVIYEYESTTNYK